jgi:hypothetical protein
MSATINFHIADDSPAPRVGGPYGPDPVFALEIEGEAYGSLVRVFATNDQLAAIRNAIDAHLEMQTAGDFEQEVA